MTARMKCFPLAVLATCALMTGSPLAQTFLKPLPATIEGPGGPCGCSREPLIADFNNDGLPDILMWDDLGGSLRCRLGLGASRLSGRGRRGAGR